MEIFNMGQHIIDLLNSVFDFWNKEITLVFSLLGLTPEEFNGGGLWRIVEGIEPIFVAVGSALVVLFFVIGFCSESVDIKEEMRLEVILRLLIRLGISEWLVVNNLSILKAIFRSVGNLVLLLTEGSYTELVVAEDAQSIFLDLNFCQGLVMIMFAAILSLVVLVCGFFILYTVYFRFLKLMIIVPMGALACSTTAGNRTVSHTAVTFFKYFIGTVLEAVSMALAIILCNALLNEGIPRIATEYATWAQCLIYLCEMVFSVALTVGMVKGAQALTSRVLGLGG